METVAELEKAEKDKMKAKVEKICAHGCNVFINRQLIYNYPEQIFREKGVVAIEHSDFDGTERLAARHHGTDGASARAGRRGRHGVAAERRRRETTGRDGEGRRRRHEGGESSDRFGVHC